MVSRKQAWQAKIASKPYADGRAVVIPIRLTNDPHRTVALRIPASALERHILQEINALGQVAMAKVGELATEELSEEVREDADA